MNIALITPGYSADDDDWCLPAQRDFTQALSQHHEVSVWTSCYPSVTKDYAVDGVSVHAFGNGRGGRFAWWQRQRRLLTALTAAHQQNPYDVVHGFWCQSGGVVGSWFAGKAGVPLVVSVKAGELTYDARIGYGKRRRPIGGRLARQGARRADALIVQSEFHRREIREQVPDLAPIVLPGGVNTARFSSQGEAQTLAGECPVLSVGSLVPVKNHRRVIEASAIAADPALHLHIVGEGPEERRLRETTERLGIADRVTLHGSVDHHDIPAFYRGARFCVLPSYFESHGMVVLEAAACGRATIGSSVGSLPDLCSADWLTDPDDAETLANHLSALAQDDEALTTLERAAHRRVLDNYSLESSTQSVVDLYAQTIANFPGSR